jgi:hypothetical protein
MAADSFVRWYWSLDVIATHPNAGSVQFTVSCNKYLMNVQNDAVSQKQANIRAVMSAAQARRIGVHRGAFARVIVGKGHPEDMEHVLRTGVSSGALGGTQRAVQQWADENLGVDCTGFASNYFLDVVRPTGAQVTNIGCSYYRRQSVLCNGAADAFIWDFDQVRPDDVILRMQQSGVETRHPGHIAVIYETSNENGTRYLLCAESSGQAERHDPLHKGPKISRHAWGDPVGTQGNRRLNMGNGVVVVRPFPYASAGGGDGTSAMA